MRAGRLIVVSSLLVAVAAVGTYVAGEQVEVVALRTFDADGVPHDTKLWVVDHDGVPWVRVANPEREWLRRLRENPRAELIRDGGTHQVQARPEATRVAREAVGRRFREKYGVVDWWYGVLLRRGAVPVRLDPALDRSR